MHVHSVQFFFFLGAAFHARYFAGRRLGAVVDFASESFLPGGAANSPAQRLVSLATPTELFGAIGTTTPERPAGRNSGSNKNRLHGLVKSSERHTV